MTENQSGTTPDGADNDIVSASRISKLFDIRLIVGGLLSIYGIVLLVKGLFDTDAEIEKGAGLHLNLWTGVGMLVVGLIMLAWMRLRPLEPPTLGDAAQEAGPRESRAS